MTTERQQWEQSRPAAYAFVLERTGFTSLRGKPWRIEVHEGHVTRVDFAGPGIAVGTRLTAESAPSIDGLFDELEQACERPGHNLRVAFDSTRHFPTEATYMAATELVGFRVSGFQPLRP